MNCLCVKCRQSTKLHVTATNENTLTLFTYEVNKKEISCFRLEQVTCEKMLQITGNIQIYYYRILNKF